MPVLSLSGSVGQGGDNDPCDVRAVQEALKAAAVFAPGLLTPGLVDGVCGPGTIGDIDEAQRYVGHAYKPDGRVDVGGATAALLGACVSVASDAWTFPYDRAATAPYIGRGAGQRAFRFRRSSGARSHAGRDLYAPEGRAVRAVADGVVSGVGYYYLGTWVVTVTHAAPDGHRYVVRYGEVAPNPPVKVGAPVKAGQVVGKVGDLQGLSLSMVHMELYLWESRAAFLQRGSGSVRDRANGARPFQRRAGLADAGGKLLAAPYPNP